jgi:peptide/nickel transport system permease protein
MTSTIPPSAPPAHKRPLAGLVTYRPGRAMRRFRKDRTGLLCLGMVVLILLTGALSQFWTPYDPAEQHLLDSLQGPSAAHPLGTDPLGRDVLSRLMGATWVAVTSSSLAVGLGLVTGTVLGLIAGYTGGWVDAVLSRIADVLLSLPPLLFAVAIVGALGPSLTNAMIALGVLLLPRFFRMARVSTQEIVHEDFTEAARACGAGPVRILLRHVLPNVLSPLLIQISFGAAVAIVAESGLSFLGLGAQPPTASWGSMVKEGFDNLARTNWLILPPSVMIVVTILVLSLLGDSLRDAVGRHSGGK